MQTLSDLSLVRSADSGLGNAWELGRVEAGERKGLSRNAMAWSPPPKLPFYPRELMPTVFLREFQPPLGGWQPHI